MAQLSRADFLEILRRYRSGTATPEEVALLQAYYRAFEGRPDILESFSEDDLNATETELFLEIAERTTEAGKEETKPPRNLRPLWRAAVVILLGAAGFAGYRLWDDKEADFPAATAAFADIPNNLVQLPDGSTVILSPGSKIDYPDSFSGLKKREIRLSGEAFFDVAEDARKPFIVRTGRLSTTVLGTAFNIRALPGEESISITVKRGKVRISDERHTFATLLPDQQVVYDLAAGEARQEHVDADKATGWKEEDLLFDDVTVAKAAQVIEERFGTEIRITDDLLKNKRFTTTFGKHEPLESILNSIAVFNDAHVRIDPGNNHVILSPK